MGFNVGCAKGVPMKLVWRWIIVGFALLALGAAAVALHRQFMAERVLRVAVAEADSEDARLIATLNDGLRTAGSRYRLRVLATGSEAESQRLVRLRRAELVSVRADRVDAAPGLASIAVISQEAAVLLAADGSRIGKWGDLNRRAVAALAGTDPKDPLLQALFRLTGVDESLVAPLATGLIRQEIGRKTIVGVVSVGPLTGQPLATMRRLAANGEGRGPFSVIEVEDAETLARRDRRFEEITVPAGLLRAQPVLPAEALTTLGVSRHLLARESANRYAIGRVVQALFDAKRVLLPHQPVLAQLGAPDLEADAHVRVHRGAKAVYNGEEQPIADMLIEWIYLVPLLCGLVGGGMLALFRWLRPRPADPAGALTGALLDLRREAATATSQADLQRLRQRLEPLAGEVSGLIARTPDGAGAQAALTALDLADRQIDQRSRVLDAITARTGRSH